MAELTPVEDRTIPHQELVEAIVDARIEADQETDAELFAVRGDDVIASPNAVAADLKIAVDAIRVALTASGVTA
jgi:hypothetical protein